MRFVAAALALGVMLAGTTAAGPASAHHGHHGHGPRVSFGFGFGSPFFWGYPYPYYYSPPPYYYYPHGATTAPAPTTYIERGDGHASQDQPQGTWYYCPEAKAYYPYVKQCAGGWQRVAPQPPN